MNYETAVYAEIEKAALELIEVIGIEEYTKKLDLIYKEISRLGRVGEYPRTAHINGTVIIADGLCLAIARYMNSPTIQNNKIRSSAFKFLFTQAKEEVFKVYYSQGETTPLCFPVPHPALTPFEAFHDTPNLWEDDAEDPDTRTYVANRRLYTRRVADYFRSIVSEHLNNLHNPIYTYEGEHL